MEVVGPLLLMSVFILAVINYLSIYHKAIGSISFMLSGVFFFSMGIMHLFRLVKYKTFKLLDYPFDESISIVLVSILIPYAIFSFIMSIRSNMGPWEGLLNFVKMFKKKIEKLSSFSATIGGILFCISISIPIFTAILVLTLNLFVKGDLFSEQQIMRLAWIGFVGAQGSVVSMLIRMRKMTDKENTGSFSYFINAAVKPFIGLSLAHLSYFLLELGFIIPSVTDEEQLYYAVIIAFMAGFTERISKDIFVKSKA